MEIHNAYVASWCTNKYTQLPLLQTRVEKQHPPTTKNRHYYYDLPKILCVNKYRIFAMYNLV